MLKTIIVAKSINTPYPIAVNMYGVALVIAKANKKLDAATKACDTTRTCWGKISAPYTQGVPFQVEPKNMTQMLRDGNE
jgi:hypothetical protein